MADITKILLRRDYLSNWESINPVLGLGEPGVAINTSDEIVGLKIGDGHTPWETLGWQTGDLSSYMNAITELQSQVGELDTTVYDETNGLVTKVSELENVINDENTGLGALSSEIGDLSSTVSNNSSDITTLQTNKEDKSNKVTTLSNQSTDEQYPGAKCVYDAVEDVQDNVRAEANARDAQDTVLGGRIDSLSTTVGNLSDKLPNPPNVSGIYVLKCEVDIESETVTYEWVDDPQPL